MNHLFFIAAVAQPEPLVPKHDLLDFSSPEGLFVFGTVGLVVLALVIGTYLYFSRRSEGRRRRHHRHHHHHHDESSGGAVADAEQNRDGDPDEGLSEQGETRSRRHRRRRRREHRPRNPTLAETGGLPPIRTEAPPGP